MNRNNLWQKGKLQAVVSMNIWDQYKIHSDQSDWDEFTLHLDECRKVSANRFISVWSCRRFVPTKENHYTAGDASVWQEEGTDKFFLPKKTAQFKVFSCDAKFSYIQRLRLARNLFGVWWLWSWESVQCTMWLNIEITNMKKSSIYEWSGPRNGQRVLSEPNHCFCVQWGALSIAHCQQSVDKWKIIRPARLDDPHTKMTCCCCRVQPTL